jgi:hypothetical protein
MQPERRKNGDAFHNAKPMIAPTTVIQRSFWGMQSKRTIKISSAPIILTPHFANEWTVVCDEASEKSVSGPLRFSGSVCFPVWEFKWTR